MSEVVFVLLVLMLTVEASFIVRYALKRCSLEITVPILWMCLNVFSVSLTPAFVAIWTGDYFRFTFGFPLDTWSFGMLLEVVFFLFFIMGLRYADRHYPTALAKLEERLRCTPGAWWFLLCVFAAAMVMQSQFSGLWTSWRYESAGMYTWIDLSDPAVIEGGIQRFLSMVFMTPALVVLVFSRDKPAGIWSRLISIGLLVTFLVPIVVSNVAFGARGLVTALALMLTTVWIYNGQWRRGAISVLVVFLLVAIASSGVRAYRQQSPQYRGLTDWERLQIMMDYILGDNTIIDSENIIESFVMRLDTVQDGGILALATQSSGDFALHRPFIGSILGLIPRYFWPEKPVPLSGNNSVLGTPHYLVGALRGMPWNSTGVSASGIAFWQFWWPGVAVTGFLNAVLLTYLGRFTLRGGLVGLFLFLAVARQLHFLMITGIDNWILVITKTLLAFLLLHRIYTKFLFMVPGSSARRGRGGSHQGWMDFATKLR